MELLSPRTGKPRSRSRRRGLLALGLLAAAAAGCVTTASLQSWDVLGLAPPVCQVVATWYPEVVFTPDPVHGGAPTPGLAGRVYLFGPEIGAPLAGEGTLVVDLYDDTAGARTATPIEEWRFDKDTLKRLQRRDAVGWGYTLFLPWGTYKPEIQRVRFRLCYEPVKGSPLYFENDPMTIKKAININEYPAPRAPAVMPGSGVGSSVSAAPPNSTAGAPPRPGNAARAGSS